MSVTPDFVGQVYKDTNTGNIWRANSTTPGDWTLELQNMLVEWQPSSVAMGNLVMFSAWENDTVLPGITSLTLKAVTLEDIDLEEAQDLLSVTAPNLTELTGGNTGLYIYGLTNCLSLNFPVLQTAGGIDVEACPALNDIDLSSFQSTGGYVTIIGPSNLTSINLSSLTTALNITIKDHATLAALDLSVFVPPNASNLIFTGNALNVASVNSILERCVANAGYVSGTVDISGGTSAAPAGQGAADVITLTGRGVVVTTN